MGIKTAEGWVISTIDVDGFRSAKNYWNWQADNFFDQGLDRGKHEIYLFDRDEIKVPAEENNHYLDMYGRIGFVETYQPTPIHRSIRN